jgi:adenosylmethionine-8-amino-7-oxononanoate aminotransferase
LANLKIFREEKVLEKLKKKIRVLREALEPFKELAHVGEVRQLGFMVGIELVRDKKRKEAYPFEEKIGIKVIQEARKRGVILRPLGNVIVLMPPLAISISELKRLLKVTYQSILAAT